MTSSPNFLPRGIGRGATGLFFLRFLALGLLLVAAGSRVADAATGGPDAFGYNFSDSSEPGGPVYSFEDISGTGAVSSVSNTDDAAETVNLGFTFNYYGTGFTTTSICSNGFLQFAGGDTTYPGQPIPLADAPNNIIAGWWDDLGPYANDPDGNIYYQTLGTAPNRRFIVQFQSVPDLGAPTNLNTFQFKLFEGSNRIEVHYQAITSSGNTNTIGIENADGSTGLQYYHGTGLPAIGSGPFAVRFEVPSSAVDATYASAATVPVTAAGYTATGKTVNFTLNYAPTPGTTLKVVDNTGLAFIDGIFSNLDNGQAVSLTHLGVTYHFVAWYYGGSGNDLVLLWRDTGLASWGRNNFGQLGDNSQTQRLAPVEADQSGILAGKTLVQVVRGGLHSAALYTDGTVVAWGVNQYGKIGINLSNSSSYLTPQLVNTASGVSALFGKFVVALSAGEDHTLALCSDGTVVAWGRGSGGRLGDNFQTDRIAPVAVNTTSGTSALFGKTVVAIAAGTDHNLALCSDGTLAAWGENVQGAIGDNTLTRRTAPKEVNAVSGTSVLFGKTVTAIAAGNGFSMARASDGSVATWGRNFDGQLGDNSNTDRLVAVAVNTAGALSGKSVVAIAAGDSHSVALCADDTLAAWGRNTNGQLGTNSTSPSLVPALVNRANGVSGLFGKTIRGIAVGISHTLALATDGSVSAWGLNTYGQLGDNTQTQRLAPTLVNTSAGTSALAGRVVSGLAGSGQNANQSLAIYVAPPAIPIGTIADTTINEDTPTGPIPFNVGTVGTLSAVSNNLTLVPNGNITLGGSGNSRTISITPALDQNGTATITVTDSLSGESSAFLLTVSPLNDAPVFTKGADQVASGGGARLIPGWATGITPGPPDESGQAVTFFTTNNNNALFVQQPIVRTNGDLEFQPSFTDSGVVTVSVRLQDNGSEINGNINTSAIQTFTIIIVAPVNSLADSGPGSLRQTIADAPPGLIIAFNSALNGQTLTLTSGQLFIDKDLIFDASALPAGLTISGNNASRIFKIAGGSNVSMTGITLANGQSSDYGGAIENQGTLTLDTMTFEGNQTTYRGGAISNEGTLTLRNSTLHGNTSGSFGGAIFSNSALTVTNCTFTRNRSLGTYDPGSGGGNGRGGAIFNFGSLVLTHCTLTENSSVHQGGGIDTQGGTVTLENSIIARNSSPIAADFRNATTLTVIGRNLIGDNSSAESDFPAGPLAGTAANPLDPKLSALGYYGGPTQTMHPLIGSPAIDPAGGSTTSALATDQRGFSRVIDGGRSTGSSIADLGAVEAASVLVVNTTTHFGPGSLRDRLDTAANALAAQGYHIVFDPAVFPATITGPNFTIASSEVFIDGSDIGGSGVHVSAGGLGGVFFVDSDATAAMHSLTIRDGGNRIAGAGIDCRGSLTLVKCTVANNAAQNSGGGISMDSSDGFILPRAVLDHCTVSGNTTMTGGNASYDSGGILCNFGDLRLTHTTVSNNTGFASAGGIRVINSKFTLENSIVAGNLATSAPDLQNDVSQIIQKGSNLIGNSSGNGLIGPLVGLDAKLLPLGNYGGPTQTMPPRIGSPAINAATGLVVNATDQRGAPRKTGPASDLGAAEAVIDTLSLTPGTAFANPQPITWNGATGATFGMYFGTAAQGRVSRGNQTSPFTPSPPLDFDSSYVLRIDTTVGGVVYTGENINFSTRPLNPVVTTLADDTNGFDIGGISLREALAVITDGETITFAPALAGGTITLGGSQLLIDKNITIDGSTLAAGITVSGGNASRVFNISSGRTVSIIQLAISNGNSGGANGGGISNAGNLNLTRCTVANNTAGNWGGGIYQAGGVLTATSCTIANNSAFVGGGFCRVPRRT